MRGKNESLNVGDAFMRPAAKGSALPNPAEGSSGSEDARS
jgi:hypothetical protein